MARQRGACILLLVRSVLALSASSLLAQTPADRRFIDSVLVQLEDFAPPETPPNCVPHGETTRLVCQALVGLRLSVIARNSCDSECRSLSAIMGRGNSFTGTTDVDRANGNLRLAKRQAPTWNILDYGLALVALGRSQHDSALRILNQLKSAGDIPLGVIAIAETKALVAAGRPDAAWSTLLEGLRDSTKTSRELINRFIVKFLSARSLGIWDTLPAQHRAAWFEHDPGVKPLVMVMFERKTFPYAVDVVKLHFYREARDGQHLVLAFGMRAVNTMKGAIRPDSFQVHIKAVRDDGLVVSLDTMRRFRSEGVGPQSLAFEDLYLTRTGGKKLIGTAPVYLPTIQDIALPSGTYSLVLTIEKLGGRATGTTKVLYDISIPTVEKKLAISDLILGDAKNNAKWESATQSVRLNPYGVWPRKGEVTLYSQLSGLIVGEQYGVWLEVYSVDRAGKVAQKSVISMSTIAIASASFIEFSKSLQLGDLEAGTYQIQMTLASVNGKAVTSDQIVVDR